MRMYNKNTNKIENLPKTIVLKNGVLAFTKKLSIEKLNDNGYFEINISSKLNKNYYKSIEHKELINNIYTITYTAEDLPLEQVKKRMKAKVSKSFKDVFARPRVDTGLGFFVDGLRDDILNFKDGKELGVEIIFDADGNKHENITPENYDTIIKAIKIYGLNAYKEKWGTLEEIKNLKNIDECILFEKNPYDSECEDLETGEMKPCVKHRDNCTFKVKQ